jgi:hypothetical protein
MRRIKFIWGASTVIRGRWYLGLIGLYDRHEGQREDGIALSLRGALVWSLALLLAGWLAVTGLAYWFWQRNPHNLLTYADALLYPLRRAEIVEKKGRAFLAQGTELARAGRWPDAANLLRLGLARYPRDRNARLLLAQFYQAANHPSAALLVLRDGLGPDYPGRTYLVALFRVATLAEDWPAVADISARYLHGTARPEPAVEQRWLRERRHEALLAAGRPADALREAEAEAPGAMREERRLLALLALRRVADARAALSAWRVQPGADPRQVARLDARVSREAGELAAMEQALTELRRLSPEEPAAYVYGIVQRALAGQDAAAQAALADYLFRFGGFPSHLVLLAAPLAETSQLALLEQVIAAARERGHPLEPLLAHLIDTQLTLGRWDAAEATLATLAALPSPGTTSQVAGEIWRRWLTSLIAAARDHGEPAQVALLDALRPTPWAMGIYRRTLNALRLAGRTQTAYDVTGYALKAYPENTWLQSQAAALHEELARQQIRQEAAATSAPPPPSPRPLATSETLETLLSRLQASRQAGDRPALLRDARLLLTGDRNRAESAVALARAWSQAGDRASAELLLREVLHRHPGFPPALRLQQEFSPRPASP